MTATTANTMPVVAVRSRTRSTRRDRAALDERTDNAATAVVRIGVEGTPTCWCVSPMLMSLGLVEAWTPLGAQADSRKRLGQPRA